MFKIILDKIQRLFNKLPYLVRLFLLAVYKNFGNVGFFAFTYWFAGYIHNIGKLYNNKALELIGFDYRINMYWFIPSMILFFIFRVWRESNKSKI